MTDASLRSGGRPGPPPFTLGRRGAAIAPCRERAAGLTLADGEEIIEVANLRRAVDLIKHARFAPFRAIEFPMDRCRHHFVAAVAPPRREPCSHPVQSPVTSHEISSGRLTSDWVR